MNPTLGEILCVVCFLNQLLPVDDLEHDLVFGGEVLLVTDDLLDTELQRPLPLFLPFKI